MKKETFQVKNGWINFEDTEGGLHIIPVQSMRLHQEVIVKYTDDNEGSSHYRILDENASIVVTGVVFFDIYEWLMRDKRKDG